MMDVKCNNCTALFVIEGSTPHEVMTNDMIIRHINAYNHTVFSISDRWSDAPIVPSAVLERCRKCRNGIVCNVCPKEY